MYLDSNSARASRNGRWEFWAPLASAPVVAEVADRAVDAVRDALGPSASPRKLADRCFGVMVSPSCASAIARSISLRNWRTFPGQSNLISSSLAAGSTPAMRLLCRSAAPFTKRLAKTGISSRRSRSGGTRIGNAESR